MMESTTNTARSQSQVRRVSEGGTKSRDVRQHKAFTVLAWMLVVLLWIFACFAGISTSNLNYRVFGDVVIDALGSESFDIMVSGSSDAGWSPDVNGTVVWDHGRDAPYVIDVPESAVLLISGTAVWSSVAVRNASLASSAGIHVTLMDAYRSDPALNLFAQSQFTLECDGVILFADIPGDEAWRMTAKSIGRVLSPDDVVLCHVGVALRSEVLDEGFIMPRNARVIPQLLFEGVQR